MTTAGQHDQGPLDHAVAYRDIRERVSDLVDGLDEADATQIVPATPDWRVKDVLAHLVGVSADVMAGVLEGAGSDEWTEVQVATRREHSIAELVTEWSTTGAQLEALIPDIPIGPRGQLVFDAVTHEHDLRGALGQPGARDSDALAIGFDWAADVVALVRSGNGRGVLVFETEVGERTAGEGPEVARVRASRFELLRAMTGRRSRDQVRALDWDDPDGDEPDQLRFLGGRSSDLVE
jgi:uncharacterized protein (TIGR03083 family)